LPESVVPRTLVGHRHDQTSSVRGTSQNVSFDDDVRDHSAKNPRTFDADQTRESDSQVHRDHHVDHQSAVRSTSMKMDHGPPSDRFVGIDLT
jgi:hypothetical protein